MTDKLMKRIKPIIPDRVVTPQCRVAFDHSVYGKHYLEHRASRCNKLGWAVDQCCKPSSYEIDGKFYCTQHAGQIALKILLERDDNA